MVLADDPVQLLNTRHKSIDVTSQGRHWVYGQAYRAAILV